MVFFLAFFGAFLFITLSIKPNAKLDQSVRIVVLAVIFAVTVFGLYKIISTKTDENVNRTRYRRLTDDLNRICGRDLP